MSCGDTRSKDEDTFRILVATDCHLGFLESDPRRGNDSLVTFEEILSVAKERSVDFILLAGDLFHHNKPSRKTLHSTMQLIRKYCFGDKSVPFQFISNPSENFSHCSFAGVNYEDPNYNVAIPVFSIHGNHDDPAGDGNLCALDLLSVAGLVNYFGKCTDMENVKISPVLLQKGETKLALYGIGSMKDDRLHRLMRSGQVTLLCPEEPKSWFNIMAIHQNRAKHGQTNYIPEEFLDDLLNLVIWGHEHDCRIEPEYNSLQEFYVSQPGSSVATSLCHGEAAPKHIGLLEINKDKFRMKKIPLQTVRLMYVHDVDLADCGIAVDLQVSDNILEYCKVKVDGLLDKARRKHTGHEKQPKKPLIRLRVEFTKEDQIFNRHQFGRFYDETVANSKDIIKFHRKRIDKNYKFREFGQDMKEVFDELSNEFIETTRVEDVVREFFENLDEKKQLMLLTEEGLADALQEFVDKEEASSIRELIDYQINKVQDHLRGQKDIDEDSILHQVFDYKSTTLKMEKNSIVEAKKMSKDSRRKDDDNELFIDDELMNDRSNDSIGIAGRGRGKKRGGASSQRGRSRATAKSSSQRSSRTKEMFRKSKHEASDSDEVGVIESDDSDSESVGDARNGSRKRKAGFVTSTAKNGKRASSSSKTQRGANSRAVSRNRSPEPTFISSAAQSSVKSTARKAATPGKGIVFFDDDDD